VVTPCFAFHGLRRGPSLGFLLVLAMRLSTRVWPSLVDLGVLLPQRALPWKRGPNPGLGSRSRLAVDVREHGLQLVDHWSSLLRLVGRLHSTTGDPSSVPSSQMGTAQRSLSML